MGRAQQNCIFLQKVSFIYLTLSIITHQYINKRTHTYSQWTKFSGSDINYKILYIIYFNEKLYYKNK